MVLQGLPEGSLLASFFERFFGQCLGRLREPSQTASELILGPFWLHFGSIFGAIWGPESKKGEKVKIELSLKRELNFGGPRHPPKRPKIDFFGNSFREGSWGLSWSHLCSSWARFWGPLGDGLAPQNTSKKHSKKAPKKKPKQAPYHKPG